MDKPNPENSAIENMEWYAVALLSALIVLFSIIPLMIGYALQEQGKVFMGIPVHVVDAPNHLHLGLQVMEGHILLTNRFTPEDVPRLLFNPYHLLLGWLALIFGLSIVTAYNLLWIILAFVFLLILYWFISYFIQDKTTRLLAFIFSALGAGFGYWWHLVQIWTGYRFGSADWITEINVFQSFQNPHFSLSLILLLLVFAYAIKGVEQNSIKHSIIAGIFGLILALVHPFDVVTFAFVLCFWYVYNWYKKGVFGEISSICLLSES